MSYKFQKLCQNILGFCLLLTVSTSVFAEQGLFWKATSPAGKTVYLFGTIHTDDNRVTDFSPVVIQALKSADMFMMETDSVQDSRVLMTQEMNLKEVLSDNELDTVYALADFHVMHRDAVLRTKPWLLAVVFDSPRPLTPFSQDNLLMTQAEDFGKIVKGIETASEHYAMMDDFSLDDQLLFLRAVLKRTPEEKQRDYERLIQAYLRGHGEKLNALNEAMMRNMLPASLWMRMRAKLLDERNAVMADRVMAKANDQHLFVAVGASHLVGENGLVARLKRVGYRLTPVN